MEKTLINIKYTNDDDWDEMVSMGIETANDRLANPFTALMEIYAFQKGFEACAEILKQQVIKNKNFEPDENRPDLG